MKSTWPRRATDAVTKLIQAVMPSRPPRHVCGDGFACDCARRAEVNAGASSDGGWLRDRDWDWVARRRRTR